PDRRRDRAGSQAGELARLPRRTDGKQNATAGRSATDSSSRSTAMAPLLELQGVTKRFGGLIAVNNVNLLVDKGTITSVIGPNGAGKTTIFNTITGIYKPDEGDVQFDGHTIAGKRP